MSARNLELTTGSRTFPEGRWYVAALSSELTDRPVARTLLGRPVVLFRLGEQVGVLEDRCCHKNLPLSFGTLEASGLRCGYHGLLFDASGACLEIPGQANIPRKARVKRYFARERDDIVWIWFGSDPEKQPSCEPPAYPLHSDPDYDVRSGVFHYVAPYQLIHDNLLDLSHLGYVHLRTIGGNPSAHMNANMRVEEKGEQVCLTRWMPKSAAPPMYTAGWPFSGPVDRWQEIEFNVSYIKIWAGAVDHGPEPERRRKAEGLHIRGFHGITPETTSSSHYFWTIAVNRAPDRPPVIEEVAAQTELTFFEDKEVIEAQYKNICRFGDEPTIDVHVDVGPNRARRIIQRLRAA